MGQWRCVALAHLISAVNGFCCGKELFFQNFLRGKEKLSLFYFAGTDDDYEVWYPHQTVEKEGDPNNGCLLGVKELTYRLKEDSL